MSAEITIRKTLQLPDHDSLAQCTAAVRDRIAVGNLAALQIAVLIAQAKRCYFRADYKGWQHWAQDAFGYKKRFVDTCAAAGEILLKYLVHHDALTKIDVNKLAVIATLEPHRLVGNWLQNNDPSTMTRDQVRKSVQDAKLIALGHDLDAEEEDEAPPPEPPAAPDAGNADDSLSRLERLERFNPLLIDPTTQFNYVAAYARRLQAAIDAQAAGMSDEDRRLYASGLDRLSVDFRNLAITVAPNKED